MNNYFERNPYRELPDGTVCRVYPFHISLQGLENRILCRDEDDCCQFVKIIAVCCLRKNVILVIYAVVSNHLHCVILAENQSVADECAEEIKRMCSMYFSRKYHDKSVMTGVDAKAIWIDSDFYLRNALAYDVRNAMDNGAACIQDYKWTGFRAMFCGGNCRDVASAVKVCELTKREKRTLMRTDEDLSGVKWLLDKENELEPVSICDWQYAEGAFRNDQAFFMKVIGTVNSAEMGEKLVDAPRIKRKDSLFLQSMEEISERWFQKPIHELPIDKKTRLVAYAYRSFKTDPSQLARTFEIDRQTVMRMLDRLKRKDH